MNKNAINEQKWLLQNNFSISTKFYIFSVEDHDDLTPIFDEQSDSLINSYGNFTCIFLN
jgi:hypothetical protein